MTLPVILFQKSIKENAEINDAEIMRIPYIIVVGDKEEKEKTLAVRVKGNSKIQTMKLDDFEEKLEEEIEERK